MFSFVPCAGTYKGAAVATPFLASTATRLFDNNLANAWVVKSQSDNVVRADYASSWPEAAQDKTAPMFIFMKMDQSDNIIAGDHSPIEHGTRVYVYSVSAERYCTVSCSLFGHSFYCPDTNPSKDYGKFAVEFEQGLVYFKSLYCQQYLISSGWKIYPWYTNRDSYWSGMTKKQLVDLAPPLPTNRPTVPDDCSLNPPPLGSGYTRRMLGVTTLYFRDVGLNNFGVRFALLLAYMNSPHDGFRTSPFQTDDLRARFSALIRPAVELPSVEQDATAGFTIWDRLMRLIPGGLQNDYVPSDRYPFGVGFSFTDAEGTAWRVYAHGPSDIDDPEQIGSQFWTLRITMQRNNQAKMRLFWDSKWSEDHYGNRHGGGIPKKDYYERIASTHIPLGFSTKGWQFDL